MDEKQSEIYRKVLRSEEIGDYERALEHRFELLEYNQRKYRDHHVASEKTSD